MHEMTGRAGRTGLALGLAVFLFGGSGCGDDSIRVDAPSGDKGIMGGGGGGGDGDLLDADALDAGDIGDMDDEGDVPDPPDCPADAQCCDDGVVLDTRPCAGDRGQRFAWCRDFEIVWTDHCYASCQPERPDIQACGRADTGRQTCPCERIDVRTGAPCDDPDDPGCRTVTTECASAPCEGEGECYPDQRELAPCGLNGNGKRERQCSDGSTDSTAWGPWSCEDRDTCVDGLSENRACGVSGHGTERRSCQNGQWTAWSPCVDPTERCVPGEHQDDVACGINGRGVTHRVCGPAGRWAPYDPCADPDSCRDDASLLATCGQNGRGLIWATCRNGQFVDLEECDDPDACFDEDDPEVSPCQDGVSARVRVCDRGQIDISICHPMCQGDLDCVLGAGRCRQFGDVGICDPAGCDDGRHNGEEEGVDCGGPCGQCPPPEPEVCNNADDDNDGTVDEDVEAIPVTCDPDEPMRNACAGRGGEGELHCSRGAWWAICDAPDGDFETCDGLDEDCDGQIDEGLLRPGACPDGLAGFDRCDDGRWVMLTECMPPRPRRCVDRDDAGDCVEWVDVCNPDGQEACDGLDDDCDGAVDEGYDLGAACEAGAGACRRAGQMVCVAGAAECRAEPVEAAVESCDAVDNDCDGEVDEGFDVGGVCEVGDGACRAEGRAVCAGGVAACDAAPGLPTPEICDELDNDCDGAADEDFPVGEACNMGAPGCLPIVTLQCTPDGGVACRMNVEGGGEVCNGLDDNCDGTVDEGFDVGAACEVGIGACRAEGVLRCNDAGIAECSANPGATADETCDGIDNDCDGSTDEDYVLGGDCTVGEGACEVAGTWACGDDGDRVCGAEPGAPGDESCDEVDNDCDGETDEGLGKGAPCEGGEGPCRQQGVMVCAPDGGVVCSAEGADGSDEVCNSIDDDCDGRVDEDIDARFCGTNAGICERGEEVCVDGQWICRGGVDPGAESCNDLDDDCDGTTDDGFRLGERCTVGVGQCQRRGVRECNANGGTRCTAAPGSPSPETCNGLDDDCDGRIDEALRRDCGSDTGRCEEGEQTCVDGRWGSCVGRVGPRDEVCDGIDDDCDGRTDEGLPLCGCQPQGEQCDGEDNDCDGRVDENLRQACGTDTGRCRTGEQACIGGQWGLCDGELGPIVERCNGVDDDCDGATDEGTLNACGACGDVPDETCDGQDEDCDGRVDEEVTRRCGSEIGRCEFGAQNCAGGAWSACEGEVGPREERCDLADDDCDGRTDEGADGGPCFTNGNGVCREEGRSECLAGRLICQPIGPPPVVGPETCDGRDEDCDGAVDEGVRRDCGSDVGVCEAGREWCEGGEWTGCVGAIEPDEFEQCNGLDDDCDGNVDERLARMCGSDTGRCAAGQQACVNGQWGGPLGFCDGAITPADEQCNGIDDDCDGVTDEDTVLACNDCPGGIAGLGRFCADGRYGECVCQGCPSPGVRMHLNRCDGPCGLALICNRDREWVECQSGQLCASEPDDPEGPQCIDRCMLVR